MSASPIGIAPSIPRSPPDLRDSRNLRDASNLTDPHELRDPREPRGIWQSGSRPAWWLQHREASLNWLALGLLLAAWNASDDDTATRTRQRPGVLRCYSCVSARAASLHSDELHGEASRL